MELPVLEVYHPTAIYHFSANDHAKILAVVSAPSRRT